MNRVARGFVPLRLPKIGRYLRHLAQIAHQRRVLAELDAEALADLGLTRHEVEAEIRRPFWDAPDHWQR